jgi:hypothetical protein
VGHGSGLPWVGEGSHTDHFPTRRILDWVGTRRLNVGCPTHSEPGAPSLTTALTERAPCDVVVVARAA